MSMCSDGLPHAYLAHSPCAPSSQSNRAMIDAIHDDHQQSNRTEKMNNTPRSVLLLASFKRRLNIYTLLGVDGSVMSQTFFFLRCYFAISVHIRPAHQGLFAAHTWHTDRHIHRRTDSQTYKSSESNHNCNEAYYKDEC